MSSPYFPQVRPSTIAIGTAFNHASSFILSQPVFGAAFKKARESQNNEEFVKSKEAASAATVYGSSLVGSGLQSYAVAALLKLSGTTSLKGAAYVGGLLFAVGSIPSVVTSLLLEHKSLDYVAASIVTSLVDTVGLSVLLTWWGDGSAIPLN